MSQFYQPGRLNVNAQHISGPMAQPITTVMKTSDNAILMIGEGGLTKLEHAAIEIASRLASALPGERSLVADLSVHLARQVLARCEEIAKAEADAELHRQAEAAAAEKPSPILGAE